jgi:hypothetical protein
VTAPDVPRTRPVALPWPQAARPDRPPHMRVALAFVEHRVNLWLRFGKPVREVALDRWRRVAVFAPGSVCCRVKWLVNDQDTARWQLMVLQAPMAFDDTRRVIGVMPGARILLLVDGEQQVKLVLALVDAIEAAGMDASTVGVTYWRTVGDRLAARQPLPAYTAEQHAAYLARGVLQ